MKSLDKICLGLTIIVFMFATMAFAKFDILSLTIVWGIGTILITIATGYLIIKDDVISEAHE